MPYLTTLRSDANDACTVQAVCWPYLSNGEALDQAGLFMFDCSLGPYMVDYAAAVYADPDRFIGGPTCQA